jgi:hypothetical protein
MALELQNVISEELKYSTQVILMCSLLTFKSYDHNIYYWLEGQSIIESIFKG